MSRTERNESLPKWETTFPLDRNETIIIILGKKVRANIFDPSEMETRRRRDERKEGRNYPKAGVGGPPPLYIREAFEAFGSERPADPLHLYGSRTT